MKQPIVQTFIVRVECDKPVPDLIDLVAGRAFTIDGVRDVTATVTTELRVHAPSISEGDLTEPVTMLYRTT